MTPPESNRVNNELKEIREEFKAECFFIFKIFQFDKFKLKVIFTIVFSGEQRECLGNSKPTEGGNLGKANKNIDQVKMSRNTNAMLK